MSALGTLPALPSLGQNTVDAYGNIIAPNGMQVGVVPGSVADVGSGGTLPTSSTTSAPASSSSSILNYLNPAYVGTKVANALGANVTNLSIEDYIFIVLGLIVIIAGVFGFDKTQTVIQSAGNTVAGAVKKGAEVAAT